MYVGRYVRHTTQHTTTFFEPLNLENNVPNGKRVKPQIVLIKRRATPGHTKKHAPDATCALYEAAKEAAFACSIALWYVCNM